MSDQTVAASSPAEMLDVFNGDNLSLAEYSTYRQSGELPERFKPAEQPAESAPADAPEETVEESEPEEGESEPESEPDEAQEQPPQKGSGAEKRIKQLLARVKELERAATAKQDVKPESSTAQQPAQQQSTRPKPTVQDQADGKPKYSTYEDYVEDLADWKAEQQLARFKAEQAQQAQQQKVAAKVEEARERYGEDFDTIIEPTAAAIMNDRAISQDVKRALALSDVAPEVLKVMGSDPSIMDRFVKAAKSDPLTAIRYIAKLEAGIEQEISQPANKEPKAEKTPEPRKTQAPKPPSPVGGAGSRAFDVSDESVPVDQWLRGRNADLKKKGRL